MTEQTKFQRAADLAGQGDPVARLTEMGVDMDEALAQATALGLDTVLNHGSNPQEIVLDVVASFMSGISIGIEVANLSPVEATVADQ